MKNKKLWIVFTLLLCISMQLVACSGTPVDTVFNPEYAPTQPKLTAATKLGNLGDVYVSGETVTVFQTKNDNRMTVYSIFSHFTNQVVKVFSEGDRVRHQINLIESDQNTVFSVLTVTAHEAAYFQISSLPAGSNVTLAFFDALGNKITEIEQPALWINDLESFYSSSFLVYDNTDLIKIDGSIYRENSDGSVSLVMDDKVSKPPVVTAASENFYYTTLERCIAVYDKNLSPVCYYEYPSYARQTTHFILNNGNVLVQYLTSLPADATEFDICRGYDKYDLTTSLLSVPTGEIDELETNTMFVNVTTAREIEETYGDGYLADGIENVATVCYIDENKQINQSTDAQETVSLGNDGKEKDSLEIASGYVGMPELLQQGLYTSKTIYGDNVVFDEEGNELFRYRESYLDRTSAYFYNDDAIYDLRGNLLYDLKAAEAFNVHAIGTTNLIFGIKKEVSNSSAIEYYLFKDGEAISLGSYGYLGDLQEMVFGGSGVYSIHTTDGKYKLYNEFGTKLLEIVVSADTAVMSYLTRDGILIRVGDVYYKLTYDTVK